MTQRPRLDLADMVDELTHAHTHREHFTIRHGQTWYGQDHVTTVPALLTQLDNTPTAANEVQDGPTRGAYGSKPSARLEALDCLDRIDRDTEWWIRHLGHQRDHRTTHTAVRFVASLAPGLDACDKRRPGCCDRHELEHDVRRWWTQARIVTGWDSPAWRPDNTCPMCSERGGLRVKLADHAGFCAECGETWDEANIGLLADHIRAESDAERRARPSRVACYCPITVMPNGTIARPIVVDLRLCPACGSARCVHALEERPAGLRDEAS